MKEDHINRIAKKIRNKLIYFIHLEMKKKLKCNNYLLINSMSPNELNNKYQKCSDYCVEKIETYSSCEMNKNNNNYYHISVTYCSLNNNYHMIIDNRNIDQVIGENNIIGKYYKGNTVNIKTNINKRRLNDNENENKLEKMEIGNKKFRIRKNSIFSSLNITKHMKLINENENNEMDHINNLNSNHNNYKPLININQNNDFKKIETNCVNKMRKIKTSKNINIYTEKLKKYCSTLKIIKKRDTNCSNQIKNHKNLELASSPAISERKKNYKKEKVLILKSQKEKPKMLFPYYVDTNTNTNTNKDQHNQRFKTENQNIKYNKNHNNNNIFKLKSQTKINQNIFKIPEKKFFHPKLRAQSIDISQERIDTCHKKITTSKKLDSSQKKFTSPKKKISPKRLISSKVSSPKKISPTKKFSSPKKNPSPKKLINYIQTINEIQTSNIFQKSNKRGKTNEGSNIKKFVSGVIMNKRRMFNVNNVNFKYTNKNAVFAIKMFKINETVNKKPVNRKYRRSNTGINTKYHFKGNEIKLKENNF